MEAIIISGMPATGKTTVAGLVAKRLGIKVLGGTDILKEMAAERGYDMSGEDWWDTQEGMRFLEEREKNSDFDKETDRRLIEKINIGDVVITSYTMPWLSKLGFKIWLSASAENRARRMAERDSISVDKAMEIIRIRDSENHELYKRLYGINFGIDTQPFDLVIDTNSISENEVAEKIVASVAPQ